MSHTRIHVRVPVNAIAILTKLNKIKITAKTLDISQGGIALSSPRIQLPEGSYDIVVEIEDGSKIEFAARLLRQDENVLAFKTSSIDQDNLRTIQHLVFSYQETEDFINQIQEHNLLDQWFVDEEGNEIEIAFNSDSEDN